MKILNKICFFYFLSKLKEKNFEIKNKEILENFNANKIINTYKMHKKRKEIALYLQKIKFLQKNFRKFLWKKKIKRIIKIQSFIRKRYLNF
jgi:hypothetical protein